MTNSCQITFEGLNLTRLLNTLNKREISVQIVRRSGKKCTIRVPARRSEQTLAILRERCYNILGIEFFGIPRTVQFVKKHFVLPLFCLILAAVLAILSQRCLKIEVSGDFDERTVCSALNSVGVKIGSNLHTLSLKQVQNALANELDAMYAVVKRSGSVLYVNAAARKEIAPPIDLTQKRDIIATREGVVTAVVCEMGTPLVKAGDVVHEGDVLIEGKRIFNDGTSEDVYALGRVELRLSASGFAEFDGTKSVDEETGRVFKCTGVVLFGKEYKRACPFERYTLDVEETKLFPLNITVRRNVFREITTRRVPAAIEECIDQLKALALSRATENCNFTIVQTVFDATSSGVTATVYGCLQIE